MLFAHVASITGSAIVHHVIEFTNEIAVFKCCCMIASYQALPSFSVLHAEKREGLVSKITCAGDFIT